MKEQFPNGVWPVMLTPFTEDDQVDLPALKRLVDWYIENGVTGLFAVCQSSEMFFLSLEERVALSKAVVEYAAGRVGVISSGQLSTDLETQVKEVEAIAATGPDAVILLSNQFAKEEESDEVWWENLKKLLSRIDPAIKLGFYECPYPYKRVISAEMLGRVAATGRFYMMKDTCCDTAAIKAKLEAIEGTQLKLFNANTATLLETLRAGCCGYSGVMANFHPDLYVWLCSNFSKYPTEASLLTDLLTMCSYIEKQWYPVNAKVALKGLGVMGDMTRTKTRDAMTETFRLEVRQIMELSAAVSERLKALS